MIPQETIARILDSAQVADVVGDFVSLQRRGSEFVACCPFHNEKTPSFHVRPAHGYYKCFGCGESGTAVGFLMKHESMSYYEALRYLAKKYGIEVVEKEETAEDLAARTKRESLLIVMQFAHRFYMDSLKTDEGRTAGMAYFRSRGLEEDTIEKYGLGWAPKSRHALYDAAKEKGYNIDYLLELNLLVRYDDKFVDRFFDRVMFPIHSYNGNVIGFGGRTLFTEKTVAKYINSNQSLIYDKSYTLYGINFAKNTIHREDRCYLVEGYLDVLSMHQLGITNVVASSGTSLTTPQIRLIKKFTDKVTIMYDGDGAGIKAALRGIDLVLKEGLSVKVLLLPDGDDPDSYSRKHTLEEVKDFIRDHEQDFIEFKTDMLLGDAGNDPIRKAELINEMADTIALIPDAVVRSVYSQTVADKFKIDSQLIFNRIRKTREKLLEDEAKSSSQRQVREELSTGANPAQSQEEEDALDTLQESADNIVYENALLKNAEIDLLWFMLRYGLEPLKFDADSAYYQPGEETTVAAFISCNLEGGGLVLQNSLLRRAYDLYLYFFDNFPDKDQADIVRAMMDGPDREVADLVSNMVAEKYDLTVKNFAASMTAMSTQLVKFVPRAIMTYQLELTKWEEMNLREAMTKASEDEQMEIAREFQEVVKKRKLLMEALGRVR
ncbi:MAG: DNA primase [Bacteroidales bacterium]|nr:DNA primase [Bacteroidales bacterium]